jgi:hypothetical protein
MPQRDNTPPSADSGKKPTASLYRYYDADGILIYVGITKRGLARNLEHASRREWWPYVSTQEVEHFAAYGEARDRERELIKERRPPFNIQHNPSCQEMRREYLSAVARSGIPGKTTLRQVYEAHVSAGGTIPLFLVDESGKENKITFRTTAEDWILARAIVIKHAVQVKDTDGKFLGMVRRAAPVGTFAYLRGELKDRAMLPSRQAHAKMRLDSSVKPAILKLTLITMEMDGEAA